MPLFNSLMVATNQDLSVATLSFNDTNTPGGGPQDNNGLWATGSGGTDASGYAYVFSDPDGIISFSGVPTNNYFRIVKAGTYIFRLTCDQFFWESGGPGSAFEFEWQGPFANAPSSWVRIDYNQLGSPPDPYPVPQYLINALTNVDITRSVTITQANIGSNNLLKDMFFCQWATQNLYTGVIKNCRLTINQIA